MKKLFLILLLVMSLLSFSRPARAKSQELYFDDLTTLNFYKLSNELDIYSIKKLCTYDYCDYIRGRSMPEALEIFTKNYLKTIPDEETRSILNVKGIRITKIILLN